MSLSNLHPAPGSRKDRKRRGRGPGSGLGKTSGRGSKGCLSRSGVALRILAEGGQMPLFRRLPKRGFSNYKFASRYETVNISQLERFDDNSEVGIERLSEAGLINGLKSRVKILGNGELTKKLQVTAHKFSKSAEHKITASGGTTKTISN